MATLNVLAWAAAILVSALAIYRTVGVHYMVSFFPEGRRWWQLPAQLVSLALFALLSANHPF